MARTSRQSFKFMLRLPDDLRDRLKEISDQNGRSMTAEILDRIEASLSPSSDLQSLVTRLEAAVKALEERT